MKYILSLVLILIIPIAANAEILPNTIYAVTTVCLNKNMKKNQEIDLTVIETGAFSSNLCLAEGDNINIKIIDYIKPKRGKRNGYYNIEYKGHADKQISGKMRSSNPNDFQNLAKKTGIITAGHILKVPGFSQALAVSKGLARPNDNETRLQSAGKNLYQTTPLTYIEQGKDFYVEQDGIVVLKLKEKRK